MINEGDRSPVLWPDRRRCLLSAVATAAFAGKPARGATSGDAASVLPRLNQLGFPPNATKRVCMVDGPLARNFTIQADEGAVVFRGQFGPAADLTEIAGDRVRTGDFSSLTRPGRYRVRVGETLSEPFGIGADVYAALLRDAARTFYLIRANADLDDPVTGLRHAASHTVEAALPVDGASRDLTGGWYNAGDYGKWTHMTAISASQMMWLYELRPTAAAA